MNDNRHNTPRAACSLALFPPDRVSRSNRPWVEIHRWMDVCKHPTALQCSAVLLHAHLCRLQVRVHIPRSHQLLACRVQRRRAVDPQPDNVVGRGQAVMPLDRYGPCVVQDLCGVGVSVRPHPAHLSPLRQHCCYCCYCVGRRP